MTMPGALPRRTLPLNALGTTRLGSPMFGTGLYGAGIYGAGPYGGTLVGVGSLNVVTLGPGPARVTWHPTSVVCSTGSVAATVFTMYRNQLHPAFAVISSTSGNQDNLWLRDLFLSAGETLIGVWEGGDAGATASMTLTGRMEVPWLASASR